MSQQLATIELTPVEAARRAALARAEAEAVAWQVWPSLNPVPSSSNGRGVSSIPSAVPSSSGSTSDHCQVWPSNPLPSFVSKRPKFGVQIPTFSVVDESWELTDPNPDIHALLVSFDKEFFYNTLGAVEVKWSKRMTSCAGICSFSPKGGQCVISLSEPLLTLRPRRNLVETLLHEMIHAYLFLYDGTRDREAHGPLFVSHMERINKLTGTKISVYHSFHDEVRHYQTHWWRCDGPCKDREPYYGYVKRSVNRAPGPNDFWFKSHSMSCSGTFIKIREPAKKETEKKIKRPSFKVGSPNVSVADGMRKLFKGPSGSKSKIPVTSNNSGSQLSNGVNSVVKSVPKIDSGVQSSRDNIKESVEDKWYWQDYRQFEEYSLPHTESGRSERSGEDDDDILVLSDTTNGNRNVLRTLDDWFKVGSR